MSSPFVGEIRLFAGNFAPAGWAFCDGQVQSIAENVTLFSLIGTTYGGDGQTTFNLPDLRGRAMVGAGQGQGLQNYVEGQLGGTEDVTLTVAQIASHGVTVAATSTGTRPQVGSGLAPGGSYAPAGSANTTLANVGGGSPHENMAPFLALSFIISLFGIYPSQG